MITIDLSQEEQMVLANLLETSLDELHDEIMHTDQLAYKEGLKQRKAVMEKLLKLVRQPRQEADR